MDLVWLVVGVEWKTSSGPPGVVLVSCDALHPLRHRLLINVLRVDPSGIFNPRVHPHRVITSLERLDTSTEKYLEQIHTSHTLMNPLNYSLHQHGHLHLLCWSHFQGGGFLDSRQRKGRETSRMARSRLVFAIKPSRLPPSNRVRESHRGKSTLPPHLDT